MMNQRGMRTRRGWRGTLPGAGLLLAVGIALGGAAAAQDPPEREREILERAVAERAAADNRFRVTDSQLMWERAWSAAQWSSEFFVSGVFERGSSDPRAADCPDDERQLRTAALMGLARDEEGALPVVEEILFGEEPCQIALRGPALSLLGRWRSERAVALLIRLVDEGGHPDPAVRRSALVQLSMVEESRAVEALIRVALSNADADVRNVAFMQLARSEDARAGEALRRALTAAGMPDESRMMAARSLSRSERAEDRQAVLAAFRNSDNPRLRQTILTSLSANGSNVELLIEVARSDQDENLRRIAVSLLSRSDDPRARALLREIARGG